MPYFPSQMQNEEKTKTCYFLASSAQDQGEMNWDWLRIKNSSHSYGISRKNEDPD